MSKSRNIADLGSNDVLETTSTGVDVTGTVTADGLTVNGTGGVDIQNGYLKLGVENVYNGVIHAPESLWINVDSNNDDTTEVFTIGHNTENTSSAKMLTIGESGDISFYEDTGTTAKFFWDASAESLNIGNGGALNPLSVQASTSASVCYLNNTDSANGNGLYVQAGGVNSGKYVAIFADQANNNRMQINANGNVGIGTSSPSAPLDAVGANGVEQFRIGNTTGGTDFGITVTENDKIDLNAAEGATARHLTFSGGGAERMRIDSSGNLLVGKSSANTATDGSELRGTGASFHTVNNDLVGLFNRRTSDGDIVQFRKDGTTVGSIATNSGRIAVCSGDRGLAISGAADAIFPTDGTGNASVNDLSLGTNGLPFKDLYLSGGVYLGGTGSANYLDDYEEGTFTPSVGGVTTAGTVTYGNREGSYVKVGNAVHFRMYLSWTAISGSSGYMIFYGLPFTVSGTTGYRYSSVTLGYANNTSWGNTVPSLHTKPNSTKIYIGSSASGSSWVNSPIDTTGDLILSGTYYIA